MKKPRFSQGSRRVSLLLPVVWLLSHSAALGRTNIVTSFADDGLGSLRRAVSLADSGDVIRCAVTGLVALTSGEINIRSNLTILGPGPTNLVVSGTLASRLFYVSAGATCSISGITLRDGRSTNGMEGRPGTAGEDGGALYNNGSLALTNCFLKGNVTGDGGAGMRGVDGQLNGETGTNGREGGKGGNGGAILNNGTLLVGSSQNMGNTSGSIHG